MIALRVVSGIANHFIMRLPEWACCLILLMFGLTLLQDGNTFEQPSFSIMAHYASEDTWGLVLTLIGALRLTALVLNGTFKWFAPWSIRIRAASATLCCFAWFCIALGLFLGNPGSTGAKTYATLLAVDMIMSIYLGGQAGKVDRGLWNGRS
jgi:putative Mn2+ efflux pump MntP